MSKQKNIITNSEELKNAPLLSELQDRNSISVPDGYFDKLEDDILAQINSSSMGGVKRTLSFKKMMYYVAAASVVVLLSFFAIRFIDNNSNKGVIVEKQKTQMDDVVEIKNNDKFHENNYNKEAIVEHNISNNISTVDPKTDVVIANDEVNNVELSNNSDINNEPSIVNNEANSHEQIITDNSSKNDDNYLDINATNNTNSLAISSVSSNSQSQASTSRTIAARVSNAEEGNILLPKDTCTNDDFEISIPNNEMFSSLNVVWSNNSSKKKFKFTKSGTYWVNFYEEKELLYTDTIKVQIVPTPELELAHQFDICNHQSLLLNTGLNDDVYTHNWSISNSHKSEILLENLEPGVQDVELVVLSCADTISEIIALNIQDCNIEIPNIITPNNDGYNDAFVVKGLRYYPQSSLNIFDRNGKLVFQAMDYHNDWKAEDVADGTYFYSLIINDGKKTEKGGVLKVMR